MRRRVPLLVVLAGAAIVRLVLLTTTAVRLDGDEAVTGIMARRILDGHHLAFFAGQSYMGTGEQYLQAVVLAALPDTDLTLRLPQVALSVASCACVYAVARQCGLSERRSVLAAALFAIGPYFSVFQSVRSLGAYDLAMVAGIAGVLLALVIRRDDRHLLVRVAAFGVVCGIGLWSNAQAAYLLAPAGLWVLGTVRGRLVRALAAGIGGFLVGFAPALGHLLWTGPLETSAPFAPSSVAERASVLFDQTLPAFLGVGLPQSPRVAWLPPAFVVAVVVGALGAAVVRRAPGLWAVLTGRRDRRTGLDLVLLAAVAAPVLFVQAAAAGSGATRYVFVLYAVMPILLAAVPLPRFVRRWRWGPEAAAVAVLLVVLHQTVTIAGDDVRHEAGGAVTDSGQRVRSEDLEHVVDALVDAGARTAYADYWLAQVLEWRAGDRLVVETIYSKRFPHATRAAARDPSPALVVARNEADDVADALRRRDATFDQQEVEGWILFTNVSPGQHPREAFVMAEALD